jgi:cytochrome P450
MWRLVDQQIDKFVASGSCEFMADYAKPLSMLVIADLLGVPIEDHGVFRAALGNEVVGDVAGEDTVAHNPLAWLDDKFTSYVVDRRREPRDDVLTELAAATYPDGSVPDVDEVVKLATFLFAAGMETTTKLLSTGMRVLGERPDIQQALRDNRAQIPAFLEESLRMESPVKSHFRLARTTTSISEVDVPAGTIIMLLPVPATVIRESLRTRTSSSPTGRMCASTWPSARCASCPGAPLARAEARISLNRLLDRLANIRLRGNAWTGRGPSEANTTDVLMRGLSALHVEFDPCPTPDPRAHVHNSLRYAHSGVGRSYAHFVRRRAGDVCVGGEPRRCRWRC